MAEKCVKMWSEMDGVILVVFKAAERGWGEVSKLTYIHTFHKRSVPKRNAARYLNSNPDRPVCVSTSLLSNTQIGHQSRVLQCQQRWLFGHSSHSEVEDHLLRLSKEGYIMYLILYHGQENGWTSCRTSQWERASIYIETFLNGACLKKECCSLSEFKPRYASPSIDELASLIHWWLWV